MDPIADPAIEGNERKKMTFRVVLVLLIILVIISAGLFLYWYLNYNSPQEKLYRAFESSLSTAYVERKYSTTYRGYAYTAEVRADVKSDFTNPVSPKSSADFRSDTTSGSEKVTYEAEYVFQEKDKYMAKIKGKVEGSLAAKVESGQWYQMRSSTAGVGNANYYLDQTPKRQMFNTSQAVLPMGNFTTDQQSRLMNYIKTHNVYTMIKSEPQQDTTLYTLALSTDALNGLNKEIASMLNVKPVYVASKYLSGASKLTIAVDERSGKITQTKYIVTDGNIDQFQGTVDFSYPSGVSISTPTDVKALSGGVNL